MRTVAIVCRSPKSRYLAPFDNEEVEIWTLSPTPKEENFTDLPRWDRWYEFHTIEYCEEKVPGYGDWLKSHDRSKVFYPSDVPIDAMAEMGADYFTSSVAYMIAHAIYEGVDRLELYGADMAHATEYEFQRPCVEYWLGLAKGRGIELVIPDECDLTKHRTRYAVQSDTPMLVNLRKREEQLNKLLDDARAEIDRNLSMSAATIGAMSEVSEIRDHLNGEADQSFLNWLEDRQAKFKQVVEQNQQHKARLQTEHDMVVGCLEELRYQKQWA